MQTYLNNILVHGRTSPLLGESIPPQGVNSLIILDPYLLDLWRWFTGLVHVGHSH